MRALRLGPVVGVAAIALVALAVPVLPLWTPTAMDIMHRLAPPSAAHWLGQDGYGRDVLSRLLWGARSSLGVAVAAAGLACVIGTGLGLIGGYLGRGAEFLTMRSMDIVLCFPPLVLALLVITLLGPGTTTLIPLLAVVYLPGFVRVAYAGTLSVRTQNYVEAMRVLGAGRARIMLRTILPNIGGPILVQVSLAIAAAILLESGLSFLGLGVVPPAPSWGGMIASARATMAQAPLLLLWPCLALSGTVLAFNALCDTVRDAVDPQRVPRRRGAARVLDALAPGLVAASGPVLDLCGLTIEIETPAGTVCPVRDVSLQVHPGEILAVVGESGSGKSLSGLALMGLLPPAARVAAGAAWIEGQEVLRLDEAALRRLRGSRVAMIFQDPHHSLDPVHRIGAQVAEAIRAHRPVSARAARSQAVDLLRQVGISDPERRAAAFPHEVSGGMLQRVMIAIGIANAPRLLIADEVTTALDVTIQAQVIALLADLRRARGMGLLLITHNLPLVSEVADRIAVMYAGEIVEQGSAAALLARPLHPYTQALLRSAPGEDGSLPEAIQGTVPSPQARPAGCAFAPRCAYRRPICETAPPPLVDAGGGHLTRCIRWHVVASSVRSAETVA